MVSFYYLDMDGYPSSLTLLKGKREKLPTSWYWMGGSICIGDPFFGNYEFYGLFLVGEPWCSGTVGPLQLGLWVQTSKTEPWHMRIRMRISEF